MRPYVVLVLSSLSSIAGCAGGPARPTARAEGPSGAPRTIATGRAPSSLRSTVDDRAVRDRAAAAPGALTPERAVHFRRISDLRFSPDGARVALVISEVKDAGTESHVFIADLRHDALRQVTSSSKSERAPQWSPDGRSLAFISTRSGDAQIHVLPTDGGESTAITELEGGVGDFRWSPDGKQIAFLATENHPGRKPDDPRVADQEDDLERIWLVDVAARRPRRLTSGSYRIGDIAWPSADTLLVVASDRPKAESWNDALYSVGVSDGRFRLTARPQQPFGAIWPSPRGTKLAYVGTASGGPKPHDLFVASPAAGAATAPNRSRAVDRAVLDFRWQDDDAVVFRAANGFRNVLYRVDSRGAPAPIDLPYSVRAFDVARDGTLAFVGVGFDHLPELYAKRPGGAVRQIGHVQEGWDGVRLVDAEILHVKSEGFDIEAALLKARSSPATGPGGAAKRPLVLLVHGGPNSNFSADYFWFNAWAQLLVARGYDVLLPNPRGSIGYGEAFVKANRADWGGGDYRDLMAVLDLVIARGNTDPERLGIGGWSYGGEMTAWAIGHTNRFKAAVFGAGVFDQVAEFETEDDPSGDAWHFGTPWDHPDVFARNSPSTFIRNAKTPTLLVHGDADTNNPASQSRALYRALKHFGVEAELVIYPGEPHGPRKAGHQIDIMARMLRWYDGHLGRRD